MFIRLHCRAVGIELPASGQAGFHGYVVVYSVGGGGRGVRAWEFSQGQVNSTYIHSFLGHT